MNLSYDVIKINLHYLGYLPDYPYHLVSDAEMLDAFLHKNEDDEYEGFMVDQYPCVFEDPTLRAAYQDLLDCMWTRIQFAKDSHPQDPNDPEYVMEYIIPDWMQAYMYMSVVGPMSKEQDRHDLLVRLGCDNLDDAWTDSAGVRCLQLSKQLIHHYVESDWIAYPELQTRSPSVFGELNILKHLRISS